MVELILDAAVEVLNGVVLVVDEVHVAVDGVLVEGVVLFGGRREVEVEFGDLDEPVDESEEGRPLVRRGWGTENGFVEFKRIIEAFEEGREILFEFGEREVEEREEKF